LWNPQLKPEEATPSHTGRHPQGANRNLLQQLLSSNHCHHTAAHHQLCSTAAGLQHGSYTEESRSRQTSRNNSSTTNKTTTITTAAAALLSGAVPDISCCCSQPKAGTYTHSRCGRAAVDTLQLSKVLYSNWLRGNPQRATREPAAHGHHAYCSVPQFLRWGPWTNTNSSPADCGSYSTQALTHPRTTPGAVESSCSGTDAAAADSILTVCYAAVPQAAAAAVDTGHAAAAAANVLLRPCC